MFNFKKYALAAVLVVPSVIGFSAKDADAAKIVIDKDLANAVNVRSQAQMGDNVLGLISNAEKEYEIKNNEGDWLHIDFDGKDAYVAKRFFHILDEDKIFADTNFRKGPSIDSEIISVLATGTKVEVTEISENGYVKVKVNDKEGYVYNNLLESFRKSNENKYAAKPAATKKTASQSNTQYVAQSQPQTQSQTQTYEVVEYQEPADQSYQGSSSWAKEWIAQRESNGSYTAYNPNGGYYGRYQLNPSLVHYGASPAEQEAAADNYVAQRYGSWEAAQSFWAANGWY